MPPLDGKTRAELPNSAFAYIDSRGRRRLPIHDEAHVRNALARFNQTVFEDEGARERARERVLKAAKRYGIVPVGFVTGQLRWKEREADAGRLVLELGRVGAPAELEERLRHVLGDPTASVLHWSDAAEGYLDRAGQPAELPGAHDGRSFTLVESDGRPIAALVHDAAVSRQRQLLRTVVAALRLSLENERLQGEVEARAGTARRLPGGVVTFLMSDVEGSTRLLRRLGDRYAALIAEIRATHRTALRHAGGHEIDARADEFFAAFDRSDRAVKAAIAVQRALRDRAWPGGVEVRVRIGIHGGRPTLTDTGYVGLDVHTAARVSSAAHGGQILLSKGARDALEGGVAREGAREPALPAGVTLRRLGAFALHGLPEPMPLYQLDAPGLPRDFPPPRSASWSATDDLLVRAGSPPGHASAHARRPAAPGGTSV